MNVQTCLGSISCSMDLLQDADLASKVTFSKMEKALQRVQLAQLGKWVKIWGP